MDEEFIRNRITELRLKKGISEYQLSLELGQNRGYIQAISSGRALPSMKQFLNIKRQYPGVLFPRPHEIPGPQPCRQA